MAKNKNLNSAARAKKDKFYTQLEDVENEVHHYKDFFKGKVVLCNCDDPIESQFFVHFMCLFNHYELKKINHHELRGLSDCRQRNKSFPRRKNRL